MQRVLFLCGKNRRRSPTAEALYAEDPSLEVSSAGTAADAEYFVGEADVAWATCIVVMEKRYAAQLRARFSSLLREQRIVSLDIPDRYEYMQSELIRLLREREVRWKR